MKVLWVNQVIALLLADGEDKSALEKYQVKQKEVEETSAKGSANENKTESAKPAAAAPQAAATKAPSLAPKPSSAPKASSSKTSSQSSLALGSGTAPAAELDANGERIKSSPLARRVAAEQGISLNDVEGSGPKGRVTKDDVQSYLASGGSSNVVRRNPVEFETNANSLMRQTIAKRLTESKQQVPHFYLTLDCNIDKLLDAREQINATAPKGADGKPLFKVSVNDLIIKASALALKKVPEANSSWYDDAIVTYNNVDVSVAVAINGGLITPIIRNADQKSIINISNEMKQLAEKARAGKLQPEEYQGGGFSISNLGMYGIKQFNAIVNPPQSAILAIGAGEERPIVKDGKLEIANVVTLTLSADHRSVDGAVGATFLSALKEFIESPVRLFI
jgi:pyruvate dehydrogenase E2 component (dihydrolipoamide acetyltransferase)